MQIIHTFFFPLIGLVAGFLSGLLGVGGGVILLPLLVFVGGIPLKVATGTSLVHVFAASATGMYSHHRRGMVDLKAGLYLGLAGSGGGFLGTWLSVPFAVRGLQLIFLLVVASAVIMLMVPLNIEDDGYRKGEFNKLLAIGIGLGVGCLVGLLGVGGGFILVPLMIYLLRIPLRITIGTSLWVIFISSMVTMIAKFKVGQIDLAATLLVVSGSIVGTLLGSHTSRRIATGLLKKILICVLGLILLMVGYQTFF
jgi:uncharacterized protein